MINAALNHGFMKIYIEAMTIQPSVGETHGRESKYANEPVVLEEACNMNNDNESEGSLGSDEPDSSDDEHATARKNLKAFKNIVVDNGFGLGLEDDGAVRRPAEVGGMSQGDGNGSDVSGYHSEYPDSGEDPDTPESSSEDDMEVKKRKKKKAVVYNPNCDHA